MFEDSSPDFITVSDNNIDIHVATVFLLAGSTLVYRYGPVTLTLVHLMQNGAQLNCMIPVKIDS